MKGLTDREWAIRNVRSGDFEGGRHQGPKVGRRERAKSNLVTDREAQPILFNQRAR